MGRSFTDEVETLAHDLKTYLSTVLGYAQLIQRGTLDPQQLLQAGLSIEQSVRTMNLLLDQRLTAARADRRGFRLGTLSPTGVDSMVRELERDLQGLLAKDRLALEVELADPLPTLLIDPLALRRSLANILVNAISFSRGCASGTVRLRAQAEEHDGQPGVALYITDCGPGVTPEMRPRLFEAHASGRPAREGGEGLGLYIAHGFVAAHGGVLALDDGYTGPGARFKLWLPIRPRIKDEPARR